MAEERREPVRDETLSHELVPVAIRAERRLGVVGMQDAHPVEPDTRVEVYECSVERVSVRDVDS